MKHYVWLGFNPAFGLESKNRKTAFHVPIFSNSDFEYVNKINNKLSNEVRNKKTYSVYLVESSEGTWENLISENKYFSSIKKPDYNIDHFISNLNNVKISSIDVAKHILVFEEKCTSLRLHKLLYLVYSKYLKKFNMSLFEDKFYAWKLGPVNKSVYNHFKKDDNTNEIISDDITSLLFSDNLDDSYMKVSLFSNDDNLASFIFNVVNEYKNIKTSDLVEILHSNDSAWCYVWNNNNENKEIEDEIIKRYKY